MTRRWRARQHTATHCNILQHTATYCNTLQHTATHCNTLQGNATYCNAHSTTLHPTAPHCNTPQHVTITQIPYDVALVRAAHQDLIFSRAFVTCLAGVFCSVLQCVAVWYSVLYSSCRALSGHLSLVCDMTHSYV